MKHLALLFILFTSMGTLTPPEEMDKMRKIWSEGLLKSEKQLNQKALKQSLQFLVKHYQKKGLSTEYLAIADFTKTSDQKRLAIIHLKSKNKVEYYKVSHGKGSDKDHDLKFDGFSSKKGSFATPRGFHKMTETYYGKHGLSLRMEGLEDHNKNSRERAIVMHGADYVSWAHTGRSLGCPAVEKKHLKKIIKQLKGGALFYFYGN